MNITLTPAQKNLVQSKISTGKYRSMQEVIEIALLLFDEYEQAESEWSLSVKGKIQAAIAISEQVPPVDGENFVSGVSQMKSQSNMVVHPINQLAGKVEAFKKVNAVAWQQQVRSEWDETKSDFTLIEQ